MSFKVVIPARYASSRLPGKPLKEIAGTPMIQHVWRCAKASAADEVVIATDHEEIFNRCVDFGATAIMTSAAHESGSDRVFEVCQSMEWEDDAIIINLQGDEPEFPSGLINTLYENIRAYSEAGIATLCHKISTWREYFDPNIVKVVRDNNDFALYFSRAPIPWLRNGTSSVLELSNFHEGGSDYNLNLSVPSGLPVNAFRHLGIYAYRLSSLRKYVNAKSQSGNESIEYLEQLRALEIGIKILCSETKVDIPPGVDTVDDLERIRKRLTQSP